MNLACIKVLAACALLSVAGSAMAHPVLEFTQHTETLPYAKSNVKAGSEEQTLRVTLGRNFVSVDTNDSRSIMDFEKRRIYTVKLADRTYRDASLYVPFGFAAMELANRVRLHAMLGAVKADAEPMAPALAEHLFALLAPGQNSVIDSAKKDGATIYSWQGKQLLSVSDQSRPLPAGYQSQLWRWLRYQVGGHPKIHDTLDLRTGVPELLVVTRPDVAERVVTLRLAKVTNETDSPYSLDGFTRAAPAAEPFPTLRKIPPDTRKGFDLKAEETLAARTTATAQGRVLDSLLAHLALTLSTSDQGREWLVSQREQISKDPDASAVMAALGATTAEQQNKAVETLSALRARTRTPHAYMLDLFAANFHVALRHAEEAQKLFFSALSENPYLTGAWIDLGKLYYATYRTGEAWACWDAARMINPNHPLGRQIDDLEKKMAADHPEFF